VSSTSLVWSSVPRLTLATPLLLALGCGDSSGSSDAGDGISVGLSAEGLDSTEGADSNSSSGPKLDMGPDEGMQEAGDETGDDCGGVNPPEPDANLTGFVYAPNLEIPISGALVYLTDQDPEPIPDGVYCAECVELPCDAQFVLTQPNGSFSLPAVSGPGQKLVVQKGQFLHVTDFDVVPGNNAVPAVDSSLPGEWNPAAGHWIPRIAVYEIFNDSIFNLLAKIGLGQVNASGELVMGTEQFDILDPFADGDMLDSLGEMQNYHIIFIPCMSQGGLGAVTPIRELNIRDWTEAGGKWYVTDWANEYLYEPFPTYQDFHQAFDPDLGLYESQGTIVDPDLQAWLAALPAPLKDIGNGYPTLANLPSVAFEDNWSGLDAIHDIFVQNMEGEQVNVGHHTWVEGPCGACSDSFSVRPMTVSGGYGCGRMMFSTYHTTESTHLGLTPQELVLLYIILEIGVCHGEPPPPPPPIE
jgi:hypothetical protein